ncbi:uncharacterized protein HMPREF1120_03463 [Exophiala dermatitidis NIH/UT8656]|uniref:Uncharacterized protein n=1 Tax=Exophiala dermatitidis (strain ATCC 34100 / CBS 525.76 / NIH/UT8656) TaxID=858893 RepID=H6BX36_EXODN|nr:uncharacterized protein HMPREF1120_03463 [Exophiala dermatitidis NIH/UT8656]EHY55322.1 hypothetical protein HMPREF1120_03463 [Exophiala dermatitidis NIH/UT8656]
MCGMAVRGSGGLSSAGGVGSAVMLTWLAVLDVLVVVVDRCRWARLLAIVDAMGSSPSRIWSAAGWHAVEGRLMFTEEREDERLPVSVVGVLIRVLMLLIRAWLSAMESRGKLDLRSPLDLELLLGRGRTRDSWLALALALAMTSHALAGKSGTSKSVASAAGNPEWLLLIDRRLAGRSGCCEVDCDSGLGSGDVILL